MEWLASSLLFCVANLSYWWEIPGQTKTGFYSISHQSGQVQRGDPSWKSEAAQSIRISIEGTHLSQCHEHEPYTGKGKKGGDGSQGCCGNQAGSIWRNTWPLCFQTTGSKQLHLLFPSDRDTEMQAGGDTKSPPFHTRVGVRDRGWNLGRTGRSWWDFSWCVHCELISGKNHKFTVRTCSGVSGKETWFLQWSSCLRIFYFPKYRTCCKFQYWHSVLPEAVLTTSQVLNAN